MVDHQVGDEVDTQQPEPSHAAAQVAQRAQHAKETNVRKKDLNALTFGKNGGIGVEMVGLVGWWGGGVVITWVSTMMMIKFKKTPVCTSQPTPPQ